MRTGYSKIKGLSLLGLSVVLLGAPLAASANDTPKQVRPKLQIINGSSQAADIFWLKSASERVPNGTVEPGRYSVIDTSLGHRFEIVGRSNKAIASVTSVVPVQAYRFDPEGRDGVPKFYTQVVSADGFPIVGSDKVNPYALKEAAFIVKMMLSHRPDLREALIKSGARLCVMAVNEYTTDLPEFKWLAEEKVKGFEQFSAKDYRDVRARGMGGSETDPYCSVGEENLLCYAGDPYRKERILIHEFAHCAHLRGMVNVDPTFDARVRSAYEDAMKAGRFKGKYASINHHEYFAVGVASWYGHDRFNDPDHNHVHTRAQLVEYDPGLAALCREVFGEASPLYTKPATRLTGHLAGYNPETAPTFKWPERLLKVQEAIRAQAKARNDAVNGREVRTVSGWTVNISKDLLAHEAPATAKALDLLKKMLDEIVAVVPAPAVSELQKVSLYLSPEYPNIRPRAEYHPNAAWLKEHGRDPVMAKGVEFTNVRIFEREINRMPNFALHELAHAYHDRVLGYAKADILATYTRAKESRGYDKVEHWHGSDRTNTFDKAYAISNEHEYFAENTEAFFSRNDFFPFTREELKKHDPDCYALLGKLWSGPLKGL